MVGVGRPANYSSEIIQNYVLEFSNAVVEDGKIVGPTNSVWLQIQKNLPLMSPKAIYTYVWRNKEVLRNHLNLCEDAVVDYGTSADAGHRNEFQDLLVAADDDSCLESDGDSTDESVRDKLTFNVLLTENEWNEIKPIQKLYRRNDAKCPSAYHRLQYVLPKNAWTNVINEKVWFSTKLPCTWVFKRSRVSQEGINYLTMNATCKQCKANMTLTLHKSPSVSESVELSGVIENFVRTRHNPTLKRQLKGVERQMVAQQLTEKSKPASTWRVDTADKIMEPGDIEPAHLYSLQQVRKAKSEMRVKSRIHDDPLQAVTLAKYLPELHGAIHQIAADPFFVHYWSSEQMHVWNEYSRTKMSVLYIDATGSLVRKLEKPYSLKSGHIFLYHGVLNDMGAQFSVTQMLSEKHDAVCIQFWLSEWIRAGASIPKETVSDFSLAILGASVRAFTSCSSLENYLDVCGRISVYNDTEQNLPTCFIRTDTAHLMKLASRWPCLVGKEKKRTRQFFLRCLGLLIKSESVEEVKDILLSIFVVALSESGGTDIVTRVSTISDQNKTKLRKQISEGRPRLDVIVSNLLEEEVVNESEKTETDGNIGKEVFSGNGNIFGRLAQSIVEQAKETIKVDDGEEDNAQFLPQIVDHFVNLFLKLPLWSGIMIPFFGHGRNPPTSGPAEGVFSDLKTRVLYNKQRNLRVDEFLMIHLKSLSGTMKIAAAKQKMHETQSEDDDETSDIDRETGPLADRNNTQIPSSQKAIVVSDSDQMLSNDNEFANNRNEFLEPVPWKGCQICASGNLPGEAHTCIKCSKAVHIFEPCSFPIPSNDGEEIEEGYGTKRICNCCHERCISESRIRQESGAIENWRGKSSEPPRKRWKHSYIEAYPEMQTLDLSVKTPSLPIAVMKNGSGSGLKPIRLMREKIILSNTCAFDALVHCLAAAFVDSENYRKYASESAKKSDFFALASQLSTSGITRNAYYLRAKCLRPLFKGEYLPNKIKLIMCETTVSYLARKIWANFPSFVEESVCSSEYCEQRRVISNMVLVPLDLNIFNVRDLCTLESSLNSGIQRESGPCPYPIKDRDSIPNSAWVRDTSGAEEKIMCSGRRQLCQQNMQEHVLIEFASATQFQENPTSDSSKECLFESAYEVSLTSFPRQIKVKGSSYCLRGVIAIKHSGSSESVGHYISYCLRNDNTWHCFDDLHVGQKQKPDIVPAKTKVVPHLLFYTV